MEIITIDAASKTEYLKQTDRDCFFGEGYEIPQSISTDPKAIAEFTKLDWSVKSAPPSLNGLDLENHRAIYKDDSNGKPHVFGFASPRWKPYQNLETLQAFCQFCEDAKIQINRVGSLRQDSVIFASADLNRMIRLKDGDEIAGKIVLTNSHEPGRGLKIHLVALRLICTNGVSVGLRLNKQILNHTAQFKQHQVAGIMQKCLDAFYTYGQEAESLTQTPFPQKSFHAIAIKLLGDPEKSIHDQPKAVGELLNLYSGGARGSDLMGSFETAWGAVNSVTEYFNHYQSGKNHLYSLWYDSSASKQRKGIELVKQAIRA